MYMIVYLFFLFNFFLFFRATSEAFRSSQARGRIRAVASNLCQSLSNAGLEPRLRPTTLAQVAAVAWVQSLAWELLHAVGVAKKFFFSFGYRIFTLMENVLHCPG